MPRSHRTQAATAAQSAHGTNVEAAWRPPAPKSAHPPQVPPPSLTCCLWLRLTRRRRSFVSQVSSTLPHPGPAPPMYHHAPQTRESSRSRQHLAPRALSSRCVLVCPTRGMSSDSTGYDHPKHPVVPADLPTAARSRVGAHSHTPR